MKLYGTPPTRATRVLWVLRELQVECEVVFLSLLRGDHRQPEYLAINPAARVPALQDGDLVLTESVAICLYLCEKYGGLIPSRAEVRAQMYRWMMFVVTEIEQPLERIERHQFLYPEEQRSPAEVERARAECQSHCAILAQHLRGRTYLAGDQLSVADLITAYTLQWADENQLLEPELREYKDRLYALPSAPPTTQEAIALLKSGQPVDWLGWSPAPVFPA